jgi:hypothetical protein
MFYSGVDWAIEHELSRGLVAVQRAPEQEALARDFNEAAAWGGKKQAAPLCRRIRRLP